MDELAEQGVAVGSFTMDSIAEGYRPEYFRAGKPPPLPSWNNQELISAWLKVEQESLEFVTRRTEPLLIDAALPLDQTASFVSAAVNRVLRSNPAMRKSLVEWRLGPTPILREVESNFLVEQALDRLWDGMRTLPYTDIQIAQAIGTCVNLFRRGIGTQGYLGGPGYFEFSIDGNRIENIHRAR